MIRSIMTMMFIILSIGNISTISSAAEYNIKQMTPGVTAALESRRARYDQLQDYKKQGLIGENNQGYVTVLKAQGDVASIVDSENTDRKVIYETIAEQNELSGAVNTIEKVFARVQRDKAQSGDKIQLENGNWVSK
ncbi:MAG: YdbL family protein [Candidatus Omnitrophica bacterium]|nr:YdbL family protein [Candidatus Omnitrophota bacterium]